VPEDRATNVKFDALDVCLDDGVDLRPERRHARALHEKPVNSRKDHAIDVFHCGLDSDVLLDRNDGYEIMAISVGLLIVEAVNIICPR